jgi:hypothetical protein
MTNRIANEWQNFERVLLDPARAGRMQRQEMRRAFYAGAQSLFTLITLAVSPGDEITQADLTLMEDIDQELKQFGRDVQAGKA